MTEALGRVSCPNCVADFQSNFKICPSCGKKLGHNVSASVAPTSLVGSPLDSTIRSSRAVGSAPKLNQMGNSNNWVESPPAPWRRWAARYLDLTVNGILMALVFAFLFYQLAPYQADQFFRIFHTSGGVFFDIIFTSFVGSLLTGLIIGLTGSSLGKIIFGIKVTKFDGSLIGPMEGIVRDINIYIKGLGLGVPIISLFTQGVAYKRLKETGLTSWDHSTHLVTYRKAGPSQNVFNTLGIILLIVVGIGSRTLLMI